MEKTYNIQNITHQREILLKVVWLHRLVCWLFILFIYFGFRFLLLHKLFLNNIVYFWHIFVVDKIFFVFSYTFLEMNFWFFLSIMDVFFSFWNIIKGIVCVWKPWRVSQELLKVARTYFVIVAIVYANRNLNNVYIHCFSRWAGVWFFKEQEWHLQNSTSW